MGEDNKTVNFANCGAKKNYFIYLQRPVFERLVLKGQT